MFDTVPFFIRPDPDERGRWRRERGIAGHALHDALRIRDESGHDGGKLE
jgi:hypothetical protein